MAATAGTARQDPRRRYQEHVRLEVKAVALRQLAAGGPPAVSLNAIAKELGVSGPALYRYYRSRDDLLTDLVLDTYADLRAAVTRAVGRERRGTPADRVRAFARASHRFARAHPHRYRLLFTPPLSGYDANTGPLVAAAHALMPPLFEALREHAGDGGGTSAAPATLADQVAAWLDARSDGDATDEVSTGVAIAALTAWSRLHGIISLDLGGVYDSMGIDAAALVDREVDDLLSRSA